MKSNTLKIGIVGVGRFGSRHLGKWLSMDGIEFIGFNDIDPDVCSRIQSDYGVQSFALDDLLSKIDILDVVVPAVSHFPIALHALEQGKHVFVEKPFTESIEQATMLAELAAEKDLKIGIGHIERFNPVFIALKENMRETPRSILAFRQGPFIPKVGLDVSIIMELMVHDIDIVRQLVPYPITAIQATGEILHSNRIDRATAILTFENGTQAVLFASRAEDHRRREILCECESTVHKANLMKGTYVISGECEQTIVPRDAMQMELNAFVSAIRRNEKHIVNEIDGMDVIRIAEKIENLILNK